MKLKEKYSKEELYIKIRAERLRELMNWRNFLPIIVEAVREVLGDKPLYVFGSAIEGKLTVDSDVDIAIIVEKVPEKAMERARIIDKIWEVIEKRGVSYWYPVELHLITLEEKKIMERSGTKFINIKELLSHYKNDQNKNKDRETV